RVVPGLESVGDEVGPVRQAAAAGRRGTGDPAETGVIAPALPFPGRGDLARVDLRWNVTEVGDAVLSASPLHLGARHVPAGGVRLQELPGLGAVRVHFI